MIPFNIPYLVGAESKMVQQAIEQKDLTGDGHFTRLCQDKLQAYTHASKVLLTSSCTHALEASALLAKIQPGDEVIMPSFTFVSSANAFVLCGARIVFVDIRPDTMNIDETLIEAAITSKTKAILVMHYAGVACEMDTIMDIANRHELLVVEDAAQCIGAYYKGKHLGTIGHLGTFSFHSTKNIHCGEGGALLINDENLIDPAEVIRDKGTNRKQFMIGEVDKYSWVSVGSSYLMSELQAAFLYAQFEALEAITAKRVSQWNHYQTLFAAANIASIECPQVPSECAMNGHIFFIKCKDQSTRARLIDYLKEAGIKSVFHYIPLHSSEGGKKYSRFHGKEEYTTKESDRLLRLPLYPDLKAAERIKIVESIKRFLIGT